jgi:hypothetical protein
VQPKLPWGNLIPAERVGALSTERKVQLRKFTLSGEGGSPLHGEEIFHKKPILYQIEQGLAFYVRGSVKKLYLKAET